VRNDNIRIIHHGIASPSRRLESNDRNDGPRGQEVFIGRDACPTEISILGQACRDGECKDKCENIPPIPMNEIVTFTNAYDIGLFLSAPTTFNLKYALPNKLFEFVQARLAVAIGPSIEMRKIVEKYDCGSRL